MRWDSGPRRIWSYEGRGRLAGEPRGKWPAEAPRSQPPLEASGEAQPSSSCGVCGEAQQSFYAPFESVPCSDYGRPRWLEVKEGWDYCSLCRLYATDGHLRSERHRYRQEMYEWENAEEGDPPDPPEAWGDPSYFEWRMCYWWCKLCEQWSDAGHVQGKRHTKRVQWETWDGEDNAWANTKWAGPVDSEDDLDTRTPSDASKPTLDPWGPAWEAHSNSTNSLAAASKRSHQRAEGSRSAGIEQEDEDAGAVEWC